MTVLIRNLDSSFLDTVSVEITMKLKSVKSMKSRSRTKYLFCHKIPEIMGCVASPRKCCGKEF